MRLTAIHSSHVALGGRMVPFAGFEMPVRYDGLTTEHMRVREAVGLFDVSHMGELRLVGEGAVDEANRLFANDVRKGLPASPGAPGRAIYGTVCREDGGILDDMIAYPFSETDVLFCVNAANVEKIRGWFGDQVEAPVALRDESETTAQIAVQGPQAPELIGRVLGDEAGSMKRMRFASVSYRQATLQLATTGYTGERGGEIFVPAEHALALWEDLLDKGADLDVLPIGLGARDTLRLEKGFCLYGNDIDETTTPLQAGLSWTVKLKKGPFIGREALVAEKEAGPARRLTGLIMTEPGIPRQGYAVSTEQGEGKVTSGTMSPCLRKGIAMAYVPAGVADGDRVEVEMRGKGRAAVVAPPPFV